MQCSLIFFLCVCEREREESNNAINILAKRKHLQEILAHFFLIFSYHEACEL